MIAVPILRLPHAVDLPLPAYETRQAAGLDLMACIPADITLAPGRRALIPTGFAVALPAASTLRRWLLRALRADAEVTLRFVGTREGRRLNRDFRGRDYATDVLTFDYARAPLRADIVLCLPVIARAARRRGKPLRAHLAHLVIHGALHAQGHRHDTAARARRMERLEATLLAGLRYPDPYEANVGSTPKSGCGARPRRRRH